MKGMSRDVLEAFLDGREGGRQGEGRGGEETEGEVVEEEGRWVLYMHMYVGACMMCSRQQHVLRFSTL